MKSPQERVEDIIRKIKEPPKDSYHRSDVCHHVFCTTMCYTHHCICRHNANHNGMHWCGPGLHEF